MILKNTIKLLYSKLSMLSALVFLCQCNSFTDGLKIDDKVRSPQTDFALADLDSIQKELTVSGTLHIQIDEAQKPQGYRIETTNNGNVKVIGGDSVGAMYGILDVAEQLKLTSEWNKIEAKELSPLIEKRGIKYNIPLDSRLPGYDDTGDAAQNNIKEMWSKDFWYAYLDDLARNRYNVMSLWSKHPFPSLIKLKDFPKIAMDDVYAFGGEITPDTHKDWGDIDLLAPENLKLIKKITIDEKIAFWQDIMQYAHDRGIEFYFFTWNIYITGAEKYGINPFGEEAIPYLRACVKELAVTYPHLSGIGVTAGESLPVMIGERTNVQWLYDTYGKGIEDALETDPNRSIRFIFRRHHTNLPDIEKDFTSHFPGKVETSFKYGRAHMYSSATPTHFDKLYADDVTKYSYKCWMNLRNDGIFAFRWGDPDYVRTYMEKLATYPIAGFYIGSDGYVWGREFISKNPALSGELEVHKHWYREMLWGRLAYQPTLDTSFFLKTLNNRFPKVNSEQLYTAWQTASKIIPTINNFHWKAHDELWDVEGCINIVQFQNIRDFIDGLTIDSETMMNIPEYGNALLKKEPLSRTTPIQIADTLLSYSNETFAQLEPLKANTDNTSETYKETIADIEAMAWLGQYYGHKIKGAVNLYLYEAFSNLSEKAKYKTQSINDIEKAITSWEQYAANADSRYKPQLLARTAYLDWKALIPEVKKDLNIINTSTGELPKISKIFCYANLGVAQVENLKKVLEERGFICPQYPPWQINAYAYFKARITITETGDKDNVFGRFKDLGGKLPDDFNTKGFAILKKGGIQWVIGKNIKHTIKGVEEFTRLIETNQIEL